MLYHNMIEKKKLQGKMLYLTINFTPETFLLFPFTSISEK